MIFAQRLLLPALLLSAALAGCDTNPSTSVHQPMTTRPVANPVPPPSGSIYNAGNSRPLFEDVRARYVGDTLTINMTEKTSATKSTNESSDRKGSAAVDIPTPTILGYQPKPPWVIPVPGGNNNIWSSGNFDTAMAAKSAIKFENKDSDSNNNNFTGTITVTVIEVLANGNLVVSGEKQVAINQQTEFIRLSGVVNPIHITVNNSVNSTQLADARIESKGKQSMDGAQIISMLSRFFVALLPF